MTAEPAPFRRRPVLVVCCLSVAVTGIDVTIVNVALPSIAASLDASAPYTPGAAPPAGTGPGMMSAGDWAERGRMHGTDFNDHFTDAMTANRTAKIALCRTELANGASPQAQALARTMLTEREAELTHLRAWHSQSQHGMMPG